MASPTTKKLLNFVASVLAPDLIEAALNARQAAPSPDPQMSNALLRSLVRSFGNGIAAPSTATAAATTTSAASALTFTPVIPTFEAKWLGGNAEEEAMVNEYLSFNEQNFGAGAAPVVDENAVLGRLNERLATEAYLAGGSSHTLADCVLYWSLATRILTSPEKKVHAEKSFKNVIRWFDQIQHVVAERTGSPALLQFKFDSIHKTLTGNFEFSGSAASQSSKEKAEPSSPKQKAAASGPSSPKNKKKKTEATAVVAPSLSTETAPVAADSASASGAEIVIPSDASAAGEAGAVGEKEKKKKEKKEKPPAAAAQETPVVEQPEITKLEIKVGRILKASKHPSSEHLLVEEIDVGEATPRTICSGISEYYPDPEALVGKLVCVVSNLKPRKMAGIESNGMVLAGSSIVSEEEAAKSEKKKVVLCECHSESKPGETITFAGIEPGKFEPFSDKQVDKKKVWEKVAPDLLTTDNCEVVWRDSNGMIHHFVTSSGTISAPRVPSGTVA